MSKGAKLRSIRRMIRLDLTRYDIIEEPAFAKAGKFKLVRNKETGKLQREFPLVKDGKKQIINQNKIGYRKIKKQFLSSENFNKAFGGSPKFTERSFYDKLNKEKSNEQQN